MTEPMTVALAQVRATRDPATNLDLVRRFTAEAAGRGAGLVVFPEATMVRFGPDPREAAEEWSERWLAALPEIAREHGVVLVAGIFTPSDDGRVRNRVLVTDGQATETHYDKIHLFDAYETKESDHTEPGDQLVDVEVLGTRLGLTTCYDVRFADQFTSLGRRGCQIICLPTAWADGPRKAEQWELLVRARAMDAQAFVLGCDQAFDPEARLSFGVGGSLVAGPLGEVIAQAGSDEELLVADLDLAVVDRARGQVPVLQASRR
ncbi:carbon-nitrogen hydrolase family protein [Luteococcus sp. Sow4_B9]|uniref:carbon-nitrogen hydrolase family protein n=1 Tax=Luteococcus sp. Sow4_B9 TaxID=3438792 RepID=UPI003F9E81D9